MRLSYELSDLTSLTDLCDATLYDARQGFLFDRLCFSLSQYKKYAHMGDLIMAGEAKNQAFDDLSRLLDSFDDGFMPEDAALLLDFYIPEYMDGWMY